jgi:colanic acid/amylovoran biosynthesis protein
LDVVGTMLGTTDRKRQAEFCPDVAFALDSVPVEQPNIQPPLDRKAGAPLVGFNINGLLYNGGYTRDNMFGLAMDYKAFVHRLAEEILSKTDAQLLLIPHTFAPAGHVESDNEASQRVIESLAPRFAARVHVVSREYDQSEIKSIIGMCDFFIGSRMHACIAALSQGVPAVGVAYSRKFKGVFDSVDVGEVVVDARDTSTEDAVTIIMKTFDERVALKSTLSSRLAEQKELLFEVFRGLTGSPASLQGSREETQPAASAASM